MRMKSLLLVLIGLFFCLNIAFATDTFYRVGEDVDIKVYCENDGIGGSCGATTTCNLTLNPITGAPIVKNVQMTNSGSYHNYTVNGTNLSVGQYSAYICCIDGTEQGCVTNGVIINNIGSNSDTPVYISMIVMGIFLLFSIIMTFFFYANESWFKYLFLTLDFLFPAVLCYFAYLLPSNITNSIGKLYMYGGYVFAALTAIIMMMIIIEIILLMIARAKRINKQKEAEEWGQELL